LLPFMAPNLNDHFEKIPDVPINLRDLNAGPDVSGGTGAVEQHSSCI
jgi:hypothetical protein